MLSRLFLALLSLAAFCSESVPAQDVPRWGRFESSVQLDHGQKDPLREVRLVVTWIDPDGRRLETGGFYDGEQTWRFRCLPNKLGTWTFRARWDGGETATSGKFQCVESEKRGMLKAYPDNPIWFADGRDGPFLMRSLHVGDRFFATNWDDPESPNDGEKRTAFLDWAQQQGYNTLSIASHYLNRSVEGRGMGWDTPQLWPIRPQEYQKLESILNELAKRNIYVFPFAGFFGRGSNFPSAHDDQRLYVEYVNARLGSYYNGLYNVGGPEPLYQKRPYASYETVNRWARMIRAADPWNHPLTVHGQTGDDLFRGEPWFDFGTIQGPKTLDREELSQGLLRNHHPARPLYAQETLWPGNTFGHPNYSDDDIRKNAFVILFSAAMLNFGDMDGSSSSGFSDSMDLNKKVDSRHQIVHAVWDIFSSLPWASTRPRQDLVDRGYCLADPGRTYLVYCSEGEPVKLRTRGGSYSVQWVSSRDPDAKTIAGSREKNGMLTPPCQADWIAVLRAERQPFREEAGVVEIEAEDGEGEWTRVEAPEGSAIEDPGGGRMRYAVKFTQPGDYYVFLLAKQGPLGRDKQNDVLLALSGEKLVGSDGVTRPDGMRTYGDWKWTKLPKGPGYHTPDAIRDDPVYFHVPKPGTYELEIGHRSSQFKIDRIRMQLADPKPPHSRAATR